MSNITPIEIFTGVNDTPTAPNSTTGCNGSYLVSKVNEVIEAVGELETTVEGLGSGGGGNTTRPTQTSGAFFYLDSVDGLDTNDGLTDTTAVKTWAKMREILATYLVGDLGSDNSGSGDEMAVVIKGTLTAPLELGLPTAGAGAKLSLHNGFSGPNWTLNSAGETDKDLGLFVGQIDPLTVEIFYATININNKLTSQGINLKFALCQFVINSTLQYNALTLKGGTHEINVCDFNITDFYNQAVEFDNCFVSMESTTLTGFQKNAPVFKGRKNAVIDVRSDISTDYAPENGNNKVEIALEQGSKVFFPSDMTGWEASLEKETCDVIWRDENRNIKSHTIIFATLTNAHYWLWLPRKRCKIRKVTFDGGAGTGNFLLRLVTLPPANSNDFIFEQDLGSINLNWLLLSPPDEYELYNWDVPAGGGYGLKMIVSSASSLANIFIQVDYEEYYVN